MSLVLTARAPGKVEIIEAEARDPGSGEVRVAVRRCGICGSDLHWFLGRQPLPAVCPGHEISGVVEAVGRDVRGWSEGDAVAIEPLVRCGACALCKRGDYHLCSKLEIAGAHFAGGMASSLVVPAYTIFKLPGGVDAALGALAEPTAVGVHALRLAGVRTGARVLVLGAGTIGLLAAVAARHLGAEHVAITARHPHQREAARRLGCDQVLDSAHLRDVEGRPSAVIETVGGEASTIADGVLAVARGGTVVMVGLFDRAPAFDPLAMLVKEVRLVGSMVYGRSGPQRDFDTALDILVEHGERLRSLVTHVFALRDAQEAFDTAADKGSGAIKVMLEPSA